MQSLKFLREIREDALATYHVEDFEKDFIARSFLWRRAFIVNEPDGIRRVLLDNASNYRKSELTRRLLEPGIGRGLLTSEGDTWRRHRRIMAPAFDPKSVAGYLPTMVKVTISMLERWAALSQGSDIDINKEMMHTTLHIISKAMFSVDSDEIVNVVERGVEEYQKSVRPTLLDLLHAPVWLTRVFSPRKPIPALSEFDRSVDALIDSRLNHADGGPADLLSRLIAARDDDTGTIMSRREIRDQVVTIFMAGHETTAQALSWTFYLLAQNPSAEGRLRAEVRDVLAGGPAKSEHLKELRYTRMVLEESMRLFPPAHTLARQAILEDRIGEHRIPAGSVVLIGPWLLHRKPSLWSEPDKFDPDRFTAERSRDRHRFAYIPFGAGPRICIGAAFAMQEASVILSMVLGRYRFKLKHGMEVQPQGLITLRPRNGIPMLIERL
jgi:cytochrome P450